MAARSPLLPPLFPLDNERRPIAWLLLRLPRFRLPACSSCAASAIPRNASRTFLSEGDRKQGDEVYRAAFQNRALSALTHLSSLAFVPRCNPASTEDVTRLKEFVDKHYRLCVLTGAGISTESGIPDYRSAEVGLYARSNRKPILSKEFSDSETTRRRYWARNYIGWPRFSSLKPNITHEILKDLEYVGKVGCIVTQNVDNLHTKAGSKKVIELHGTAFRVICLNCDHKISRHELQRVFRKLNPSMIATTQMIRPDGDVELSQAQVEGFNVPVCDNCGGILKPDIVFFGDNVSNAKVQNVKDNVENLDALLILGTTLSTFSAYRIVLQAVDAKKPIAIVNIGETRADKLMTLRIEGRCGDVLPKIWQLNASKSFIR